MSYNITPDLHLRLVNQSVIFRNTYPIGTRLFLVTLQDSTKFYSHQPVELENGMKGVILFSTTNNDTYFYSNTDSTIVVTSGTVTSTNIPFQVRSDEEVVTTYDIKQIEASGIVTIDGQTFYGRDGLFKSEWLQKINEVKSLTTLTNITYNLSSSNQGLLGFVKFDGKHKFGFRNGSVDVLFEIDVNNSTNSFTIRKLNYDNVEGSIVLSFNLGKINNENYIGIYVQNTGTRNYSDPVVYSRQEIKTLSDVSNTGTGFNLESQINNITFDNTIFAINSDGKSLYMNLPINLTSAYNIRTLTEGTYHCSSQTVINAQLDMPIMVTTQKIVSAVFNVYKLNGSTSRIVEGIFSITDTITPANNIFKASLLVDGVTNHDWVRNSTVYASNVVTDPTHLFVTQTQIDSWNTDSTWLSPVTNTTNLPTSNVTNGSTCFVINEKSIYYYIQGAWTKNVNYASETQDGIITKEQFKDIFQEKSTFKTIKPTVNISRESTLTVSDYQKYQGLNVIDLTKRTLLTNNFGTNVINLTTTNLSQAEQNNMGVFGTNSVGVGTNILSYGVNTVAVGFSINTNAYINTVSLGNGLIASRDNQTLIGNYSVGSADNIFEIGNGTSSARSNIFSIHQGTGVVTAGGFAIPTGTSEQILMANGSVQDIGTIQQVFGKYIDSETVKTYYGVVNLYDGVTDLPAAKFQNGSIYLSTRTIGDNIQTGNTSFSVSNGLAVGDYSTAFGLGTTINSYGGLVAGYYNNPLFTYTSTGTSSRNISLLFALGNGLGENERSNAFQVLSDGSTKQLSNAEFVEGKGLVMKTSDGLHSAVVTLVHDGTSLRLNIQEI